MSTFDLDLKKLKHIGSVILYLRRLSKDISDPEMKVIKEKALERILQIEVELLDKKNEL